jgi:PAS domain S-box-containing protein
VHPVLKRQLKRIGLSEDSPPSSVDQWHSLIERIDRAYTEADHDRYTLERSLSICSAEMQSLYESIRQRSESQIARSEQMLRCILESVPHGVIVADENGRFIYWNAAAEEIGGVQPFNDLRYVEWSRHHGVYGPDAVTPVPAEELPLVQAMRGSSVDGRELFLKPETKREGVWVVCHGRPLKDESGSLRGGVIVFRDVSAEKATQAALARVQGDFRQAIENAPDAVAVVRGDKLLYTNRAFSNCLGFDRSELIGTDFWARVHPMDVARAKDVLASLEPSSPGWFQELRCLRSDGATVALELSAAQTIQFEGQMAKLIVARDVTERKRIQAQLLVSERMASLGTIAAGVAHEINSPLAAVIANVAILLRNAQRRRAEPKGAIDSAELIDQLQHTFEAAERVKQIVLDLNTFSRSDEIETAVDLRRVLESSLRIARNEIRHRARVVIDAGEVPPVLGNDARLGQVFLNLLVNAAHAIKDAIEDGRTEGHEIRITARQDEDRVAVEIRDTGRGMTPETLKELFTPFFTTKPAGAGTGLGLSICHRILTKHQGAIAAESELGKGTTFRVTLRAFLPNHTQAFASPSTPPAPAPRGF